MKWFIPSWNGDYRLEPIDETHCRLAVVNPTPAEKEVLHRFLSHARGRSWTSRKRLSNKPESTIELDCSVTDAGPVLIDVGAAPKIGAMSVLQFSSGEVLVDEKPVVIAQAAAEAGDAAKAVATVKRPTPCCPSCVPGSIEPATEVLLTFLTPEQHRTWASDRYVVCYGGMSGRRYGVAHRNSEHAQSWGKIARDLDEDLTIHLHDTSVPPEEEVLATMLMLQHREGWVRNEATALGSSFRYKNPFGNMLDGVADASATKVVGKLAGALVGIDVPW